MQTDAQPALLRGLLRRPVRLGEAHRLVIDAVLALLLAAASLSFAHQYHPPGWPRFDLAAHLLSLLANLPLALRRRAPVAVLLLSCAGLAGYTAGGYQPSANIWAPLFAVFTLAALRPTRVSVAGACCAAPVWLHSAMATRVLSPEVALAQVALGVGTAWAFGLSLRVLGERNVQLAALSLQLQHAQAARTRQAVTEERIRIARELHDVIAHHISVIAVQAGLAGYVFESDPPTARAALDTIAGSSRDALEEMRGLLHVLRVPPEESQAAGGAGPDEPAPGLARLPALVRRVEGAGLSVELAIEGEPYALAPGPDLSAYRVVQEALTNTVKHAGPTGVRVCVSYEPDALAVAVRDAGPAPGRTPGAVTDSGGHGLIGMHERVKAHGGMLRAGPTPDGGFEVAFTLPRPGPASAGGGPGGG
ncbi:sensor histidine kinase [Kitasatospora sp. NPDC001660]